LTRSKRRREKADDVSNRKLKYKIMNKQIFTIAFDGKWCIIFLVGQKYNNTLLKTVLLYFFDLRALCPG
jgi:hypothetical protein